MRLGLFALGTAVLLTLINVSTSERIAEQRRIAERAALEEVLPPTRHDNDLLEDSFTVEPADTGFAQIELLGLSAPRQAYIARQNGQVSGVILPAETAEGYSGTIVQLVEIHYARGRDDPAYAEICQGVMIDAVDRTYR